MKTRISSNSQEETEQYGRLLGNRLPVNSVVALFGELGAGKTHFIKGLAQGAANLDLHSVNSPTFTYLNIYEGQKTIYHFDLYRLQNETQFLALGFEEYFHAGGICCIEWSERISSMLPTGTLEVHIFHSSPHQREIVVNISGEL